MPKTTAAGGHFGTSSLLISRGPVIIYHLMGGGGGGAEDFGRDHLIFRRTKGGITENFGRIQRGDYSNVLGK